MFVLFAQSFIVIVQSIYNHLYLYSKCIFPIIYLSCCSNLGSCIRQLCKASINTCPSIQIYISDPVWSIYLSCCSNLGSCVRQLCKESIQNVYFRSFTCHIVRTLVLVSGNCVKHLFKMYISDHLLVTLFEPWFLRLAIV